MLNKFAAALIATSTVATQWGQQRYGGVQSYNAQPRYGGYGASSYGHQSRRPAAPKRPQASYGGYGKRSYAPRAPVSRYGGRSGYSGP